MKLSIALFFLLLNFIPSLIFAQGGRYENDSYNRLGLRAAVVYGNIQTNNFETTPALGYSVGFNTRAAVYNDFLAMYGVNFYQYKTGVSLQENLASGIEEIDFGYIGVQLNLFLGHKIIGNYLSIEGGPILQLNGKLSPEDQYKNYIVKGTLLNAEDIENISKINFNLSAGLSGGGKSFKFFGQYQYGISNILKGLNSEGIVQVNQKFSGHQSLIIGGILFYF